MDKSLNPDARGLEDAFFAKENAKLLERMREKARIEERRAALHQAAPGADEALIDRLLELGIGPETVLAMVLVPLVFVAWADGKIAPRERDAILRAAEERGVAIGSPGRTLLETWLTRQPERAVLEAWKRYAATAWGAFTDGERHDMRERMLGMAKSVAKSAGGFLGMGSVSAAEKAVLDELERALP